jgi:hypothetical protein
MRYGEIIVGLQEDAAGMFRCHFTKRTRIVHGENLSATSLDDAIEEAQRLLSEQSNSDELDGMLIWKDSSPYGTSHYS